MTLKSNPPASTTSCEPTGEVELEPGGLRAKLVDRLEKAGVLRDPQVRDALLAVPREVIVPRGYVRVDDVVGSSESVWQFLDGHHPADRAQWLEALHGEDSIMVQLPGEDPRTTPRGRIAVGGGFASMTTAAVGSVRLLQALGLQPGMRLLEAGTGPGLVTALACHILGDQHVTSLEVDPAMAASTRDHLAQAGYRPRLLCADALEGVEGEQFDRIVLGFSTRRVPAALLDQLAPGGVLFGCLNSGSGSWPASVLVQRTGDGVEAVLAPWPGSGTARAAGQDWYKAPAAPGLMDRESSSSDVALPERTGQGAGFWLAAGHILGLVRGPDPEGGGWTLHHPASESVAVAGRIDGSSRWHVTAGGPVEVWTQVEELHQRWLAAGAPDHYRLDLTDPSLQRVTSDSTAHALTWTLPAARSSSPDAGDREHAGAEASSRETTAGRAAVPVQVLACGSDAVDSSAGWPENFRRWLVGQDCPMCATPDQDDIGWGLRYFSGIYLDAYLWRSGRVRGYTVVRWKGSRHVADPTELSQAEAAGFWSELLAVGEALKRHYEPLKLNLEFLGNVVPHLHGHLYPRTVDDPAPGGPMPWAFLDEGHQDEAQLAADVKALRLVLGQAGGPPAGDGEETDAADPGIGSASAAAQQATTGPGAGALVHQWRINPREYQRQEERRGRRHGFVDLDPLRTALVVIDVVPFFDGPYLRGIVPQINELAGRLRQAGGPVFWVLPGVGERRPVREEFFGAEVAAMFRASGGAGPLPARLLDGLAVDEEQDVMLEKSGTSALFPGSSDLHQLLQQRSITTLLLCGTVTGVCVESTARDAAELGYRVIVVADGCAGGTDDAHNASLRVLYRSFGDVRPAAEVLELIGAGSSSR